MENSPAFEDKSHYEDHCIWIATLSNDQTVYQDDWNTPSAFERMRDYCRENQLFVRSVLIRFRSHVEKVYDGEGEGFFFRKAILGALFSDKNFHSYVIGHVKDNQIYCKKWRIPEIIPEEEDIRTIEGYEDSIIWNLS